MYSTGFTEPLVDDHQDKELIMAVQQTSPASSSSSDGSGSSGGGITSFIFTMSASNCHDPLHDAFLYPDRYTFVMWALGDSDDRSMSLAYHGMNKGKRALPLLTDTTTWQALLKHYDHPVTPPPPPDALTFTIRLPEIDVPSKETAYYCIMVEPPQDRKYHIYGSRLLFNPDAVDLVHHADLYITSAKPPDHIKLGEVS